MAQLEKRMAWEVSLPVMTRKKENSVEERIEDPDHHHNKVEDYPTLIF